MSPLTVADMSWKPWKTLNMEIRRTRILDATAAGFPCRNQRHAQGRSHRHMLGADVAGKEL